MPTTNKRPTSERPTLTLLSDNDSEEDNEDAHTAHMMDHSPGLRRKVLKVNRWKDKWKSIFPIKRRKKEKVVPVQPGVRQPPAVPPPADTPPADTPPAVPPDAVTEAETDIYSEFRRLRF